MFARSLCLWLSVVCVAFATTAGDAVAQPIETIAREALLIDATTGTVLLDKNADERMPPSSMSKIMTMYMVFERIKAGRLSLNDRLPVSRRAQAIEGSRMFVEAGIDVRVEDLIRGVIVQSGNDACIVFAEALAGSEEAFAEQMNRRARELGLTNTNLVNSTGLPDPNHYMSAKDLALLAIRLMTDFPEFYHYYAEHEFSYAPRPSQRPIRQGNRNPLLYRNIGADGIKTGHTEVAGYGLTASTVRNGRRMILVINGLPSMQARADESARLIDWGYREFELMTLFKPGDIVDEVPAWMGVKDTVAVTVAEPAAISVGRGFRGQLQARVQLDGPVGTPVVRGAQVGRLLVTVPGQPPRSLPLVAAEDVERRGFVGRMVGVGWHLVQEALN